jgi:hypothetical protein
MEDTALNQLLQNIANTQGIQTQSISQLNHDYTAIAINIASISKDVEWLKWFFLAITVAVLAQTIKMVYDHFGKRK